MDLPDVIAHILSKPGAEETTPFGPDTLVYKVGGKMFALTTPDEYPARLNLKCDPERAIALRDEYESIIPG
jgi:predicted DNA-binding protein (MmcQ/YjbR family)